MIETLQLEEPVVAVEPPKLLVEWPSPWREFATSLRPALVRSERRLAGEAPFGLIPLRIVIPSYLAEAFLIFAAIFVQVKISDLQPFVAPRFSSHDVIYYSGDELPRTQDLGGAGSGTAGRAGGGESRNRTQTIKVARGSSLVPQVVDAPNLKLPSSRDAVANLLAIRPNPGPPPSDGLQSTRTAPNISSALVAPAPNVIRDYTRNGAPVESVIAPAPSVTRDQPVTAPNFSATLVPPAPNVARDRALVAPALAPSVVAPAPNVARDRTLVAPSLEPSVVAAAPSVARDRARSAPSLAANVIPAAPGSVSRDFSSAPVQMADAVVPPPVSAPERTTSRNPKLNLPAPSVVAPPPSADISQEVRRLAGANIPDSSRAIVPPPPTSASSGTFMSSLMGKIFGATEVVPPPPSAQAASTNTIPNNRAGNLLAANVVPPPPSVASTASAGNPRGTRNGMSAAPGPNVVAPPPSIGLAGATGTRSPSSSSAPTIGMPSVVAPPPSVSEAGGRSGRSSGAAGTPGGTLLANTVVPPPPSISSGTGSTGSGRGRSGAGLGAPMDAGVALAPPAASGSGANAGVLVSSQPGSKVGLPTSGGAGSLAMSPAGGDKAGLGGAGSSTSIGHGNGSGSGMNGAGSGGGTAGAGHGADPSSHAGISPTAGPGGAGNAPAGAPPVRGVDIGGGSGIVTIPGFGSDSSASDPQTPARSATRQRQALDVDVVATASSGGAFAPYKNLLHGEKHTIYPDTSSSLGTASMEYAEVSPGGRAAFSPPQSIRTSLPDGLPHARMVVTCTLDTSGNLRNVRVLEAGPSAEMTAKVLAALRSWKFEPAMRGNQPVEVTAIIGFGIDTNDRF